MKILASIFLILCMLRTVGITTALANHFSKAQGEFIRVFDSNE